LRDVRERVADKSKACRKRVESPPANVTPPSSNVSLGLCPNWLTGVVAQRIGLSHARPNSGISGDLLSENEANPVVI